MKKVYLLLLMAVMAVSVNAQQKVNISTYGGTDLRNYDGKECNVVVNRQIFTGWNTIAMPFAMSESELNEVFGSDCRLERLVGVESIGGRLVLNFQDCKAGGLEANTPYILYVTGENRVCKINKTAVVTMAEAALTFDVKGSNESVTMQCAQRAIEGDGFYGVHVMDNAEALFTKVEEGKSGFYATRCYVKVSSGNSAILATRHLGAGETMAISSVVASGEQVDVYNLSGVKVASKVSAGQLDLQPGVYVIKGQKVLVR